MTKTKEQKPAKTFKKYKPEFRELSLREIEGDPNQPRKGLGLRGDQNRLHKSIRCYGIEDPLKVCEVSEGRYKIMDGHRRFSCAKRMGLKTVPCRIYPNMSDGEFEARRYEMQNNRKSWKPLEKANALHKIQTQLNATKKEMADLIGVTSTAIVHFSQLRDTRMEYLEMMAENGMKESHRIEFMRVLPKLRKVREYEIDDIVKIVFDKIKDQVIKHSRDFRKLSKIFERATLNESEIHSFLEHPQMTITELDQRTLQSGFSLQVESIINDLSYKKTEGIELTKKEKMHLKNLAKLLATAL